MKVAVVSKSCSSNYSIIIIRFTIDSQNTTTICCSYLFVRVTTCFGPNSAIIRSQVYHIIEGAKHCNTKISIFFNFVILDYGFRFYTFFVLQCLAPSII